MKTLKDLKLVVQPVHSVMVHEYVFEGPCRFGSGDELTVEFDRMNGAEGKQVFLKNLDKYLQIDGIELLPPVECEITEAFEISDQLIADVTVNDAKADCYLFSSIGRTYPVMMKVAAKTGKPLMLVPKCCGSTMVPAALRCRGQECFAPASWDEMVRQFKILRARKALKETRPLLITRAYTNAALVSAPDGFINLDDATKIYGTEFTFIDAHEFLDQTVVRPSGENPTKPGCKGENPTEEDMAEMDALADRLMENATECTMTKEAILNSLRFYKATCKLLDHYGCNAFSSPCPEICATRRLNENQFTPCLTHSLLNGRGVCSACEYDVPGLLTQVMLAAFSGSGAYMGNTTPITYEADGITPVLRMNPDNRLADRVKEFDQETRDHLVCMFHASINLHMAGFDAPEMKYAIHPYTGSRWGATFRHDFRLDAGQPVTAARISPDGKTLLVVSGTMVGSLGEDLDGCTQGLLYTVADSKDMYKKQQYVGNHLPLVFGDYKQEIAELGELLGLTVLTA